MFWNSRSTTSKIRRLRVHMRDSLLRLVAHLSGEAAICAVLEPVDILMWARTTVCLAGTRRCCGAGNDRGCQCDFSTDGQVCASCTCCACAALYPRAAAMSSRGAGAEIGALRPTSMTTVNC
mmetsp:Transcript_101011/g.231668  ORF Transcript_101011/g.231668 Transcript_101011/m.231668 type:complete len:122 (-) Transcript_101011:1275-1640(-)